MYVVMSREKHLSIIFSSMKNTKITKYGDTLVFNGQEGCGTLENDYQV